MKTEITELLGIKYPVIQGGMAWVAEYHLAAAVSEAGGLGLIGAASAPAEWVREQIREAKKLTDQPFGVNIMLMSPYADEVWMMEHAVFSILSPEGFASILWKDSKRAKEAAEVMKLTAKDLKDLNVVEQIIREKEPLSRENLFTISGQLSAMLADFLQRYGEMSTEALIDHRYKRFRNM